MGIFIKLSLILGIGMGSVFSEAGIRKIEGVRYHCLDAMRASIIYKYTKTGSSVSDKREFKKFIQGKPVFLCRSRSNPMHEMVTWCDGSGCTGTEAVREGTECVVGAIWDGQDDGDVVDPKEYQSECLLGSDFRK